MSLLPVHFERAQLHDGTAVRGVPNTNICSPDMSIQPREHLNYPAQGPLAPGSVWTQHEYDISYFNVWLGLSPFATWTE